MLKIFKEYRPSPEYPTYPPYHAGFYLEDYFYEWYYKNNITTERILIPVSWTTCYIDKKTNGLQELLDKLDNSKKYFTICQYDDGIKERLPKDTLQFNAGGNSGGIPIPLVCSKIPNSDIEKYKSQSRDLLCSFSGSITHQIRAILCVCLRDKPSCCLQIKNWSPSVDKNEYENYLSIATRSKFLLCPRGYGLNSFRLYEAFQLGCVPVIITDKLFLPWIDELNWEDFAIISQDIKNLYFLLENISEADYNSMLMVGQRLYEDYFTLDGVCKQIYKRLI